jgi:hypothetical protein
MNPTKNHDGRIAGMTFASIYPHYVAKVETACGVARCRKRWACPRYIRLHIR